MRGARWRRVLLDRDLAIGSERRIEFEDAFALDIYSDEPLCRRVPERAFADSRVCVGYELDGCRITYRAHSPLVRLAWG